MSESPSVRVLLAVCGTAQAEFTIHLIQQLAAVRSVSIDLRVICTPAAEKFFDVRAVENVLKSPVLSDHWDHSEEFRVPHIDLAEWPDILMLYPASANTLAKWAHGMSDTLVTNVLLAHTKPVLFGPTMNEAMFKNGFVQANIRALKRAGHKMVPRVPFDVYVHSLQKTVKKPFCSQPSAIMTLLKEIKARKFLKPRKKK